MRRVQLMRTYELLEKQWCWGVGPHLLTFSKHRNKIEDGMKCKQNLESLNTQAENGSGYGRFGTAGGV